MKRRGKERERERESEKERNEMMNLLGNKDASGGRVQVLSINAVDLVTSIQGGRALAEWVLLLLGVGQGNVETLDVGSGDGVLRATLLDGLGGGDENVITIIGGDNAGGRLANLASDSSSELRALVLTGVGRGVLVLLRVGDGQKVKTNT